MRTGNFTWDHCDLTEDVDVLILTYISNLHPHILIVGILSFFVFRAKAEIVCSMWHVKSKNSSCSVMLHTAVFLNEVGIDCSWELVRISCTFRHVSACLSSLQFQYLLLIQHFSESILFFDSNPTGTQEAETLMQNLSFFFFCLHRKRRVCRNLQRIWVLLLRLVLEPDSKQQWWNHIVIQNPTEEWTDAAHGQISWLRQPGTEKWGCLTRH